MGWSKLLALKMKMKVYSDMKRYPWHMWKAILLESMLQTVYIYISVYRYI